MTTSSTYRATYHVIGGESNGFACKHHAEWTSDYAVKADSPEDAAMDAFIHTKHIALDALSSPRDGLTRVTLDKLVDSQGNPVDVLALVRPSLFESYVRKFLPDDPFEVFEKLWQKSCPDGKCVAVVSEAEHFLRAASGKA